jgi:hypothetical protein
LANSSVGPAAELLRDLFVGRKRPVGDPADLLPHLQLEGSAEEQEGPVKLDSAPLEVGGEVFCKGVGKRQLRNGGAEAVLGGELFAAFSAEGGVKELVVREPEVKRAERRVIC